MAKTICSGRWISSTANPDIVTPSSLTDFCIGNSILNRSIATFSSSSRPPIAPVNVQLRVINSKSENFTLRVTVLPRVPLAAALSANHLSAMLLPSGLRRLYIARDADAAGDAVQVTLTERAEAAGIEAIALSPRLGDFNEDLHIFGLEALRAALRLQLVPEDIVRFLHSSTMAFTPIAVDPIATRLRKRGLNARPGENL